MQGSFLLSLVLILTEFIVSETQSSACCRVPTFPLKNSDFSSISSILPELSQA